ncbi:NACHT domain-containing protein [Nonomuraea sp. NPDC026600]|uniref:NACHT domain-containing protein n=1 Tax=Nonomuraea sp. NPDC026600 TaxID=3155363 RepID=UPI00340A1C07
MLLSRGGRTLAADRNHICAIGDGIGVSERGFPWRILAAGLAILGLAALVAVVVRAVKPEAEVNLADLAAVTLAVAVAATIGALVTWVKNSPTRHIPTHTDADVADMLAGLVERQWKDEARHRLLDDPQPIPVHWQLSTDERLISRPHLVPPEAEPDFTGRSDNIKALADAFRALARRRLVITGKAGMGKTTLAVQLLLHLLASRKADKDAAGEAGNGEVVPVPVLLPVSGWDTDAYPLLHDWLAVRLVQDYPALAAPEFGPAAAILAHDGHILPILDGLDEIPQRAGARVINALNTSLTARDQLILTSRTAEFAAAVTQTRRPLTAAVVIIPQRLTPQEAATYLRKCLPATPSAAWETVLTALTAKGAPAGLTEIAETPLGLWLIRTVYLAPDASDAGDSAASPSPLGSDPAVLVGPLGRDPAALRSHLFDQLIPALIDTRRPSNEPARHFLPRRHYDPVQVARWLGYIAHHLHHLNRRKRQGQSDRPDRPDETATRELDWSRLHVLVPLRKIRVAVGVCAGSVFGFGFGVEFTLATGLALMIVCGVLGGLLFGLSEELDPEPTYANLRLRGRFGRFADEFVLALKLTAVVGIVIAFAVAFIVGLAAALIVVVVYPIVTGLAFGYTGLITEPSSTDRPSTPSSTLTGDLKMTGAHTLAVGLTVGITFGLTFGPAAGFGAAIAFGLTGGLGTSLKVHVSKPWDITVKVPFGFRGLGTAGVTYLTTTVLLWAGRRLPLRLMRFLDDAHRLGLLRTIGPAYQFRHAALQDHLSADSPDR